MAIEGIKIEAPKTKDMVKVLENLQAPAKTLIVLMKFVQSLLNLLTISRS
mgnify:CR=1 FL=1